MIQPYEVKKCQRIPICIFPPAFENGFSSLFALGTVHTLEEERDKNVYQVFLSTEKTRCE